MGEDNKTADQATQPKVDFSTFILSLASSVQMHLGLVPDPLTKKTNKNLQLAEQTSFADCAFVHRIDSRHLETRGDIS